MRKKLISILTIFSSLSLVLVPLFSINVQAQSLGEKLNGKILLQVEKNGEAWYVYPVNNQKYFLGRPQDAFNVMRSLGLGVSNKDFDYFNGVAPQRLSGMILIKTQDLGKAYYVNPADLKLYYLGRPQDAFNVMRSLGLGITNANLAQIPTAAGSAAPTSTPQTPTTPVTPVTPPTPIGMPNPASVNCTKNGGALQIKEKILNGKNIGEYGICVFANNQECEEWALNNGSCPKGGVKVLGFTNDAQVYCAITGGKVYIEQNICKFSDNTSCSIDSYYAGVCQKGDGQFSMSNPASMYCVNSGGKYVEQVHYLNNKSYSSYGMCVFGTNQECEEWALYQSFCPMNGVDVSIYNTPQQIFCASLGADVDVKKGLCLFDSGAECELDKLYTGQCRQHYNEPATSYIYKKYIDAGTLIGYPTNIVNIVDVNSSNASKPAADMLNMSIEVTKIADLPLTSPLNYGQNIALIDSAALAQGDFGQSVDIPLSESKKLIKLTDGTYAKNFIVLSRGGYCDVNFENILIFYHNGYQIILTLYGNKDEIIAQNPSYFTVDPANCGSQKIWNTNNIGTEIKNKFYEALVAQNLSQAAENWYNAFSGITDAVVIQDNIE